MGKHIKELMFSCLCTVEGKTFAFSSRNNGLFLLLNGTKAIFIASVPKEKMWIKNLYVDMVSWKGFLFLIPGKAEAIAKFDIRTYEFQKIELDLKNGWNANIGKFMGALIWKQELVLLPEKYPAIVRMDLYSDAFSYDLISEQQFCFKKGYYCDGEHVYLPSSIAGFVLKYDLTDNKMEKVVIPECGSGIWSLTESNGLKYLVSFPDSHIICWDEVHNKFRTLVNEIPEYISDGYGSSVIVHINEKLVIFPIKANYVLEVDNYEGKVKECAIDWKYEKGKAFAYIAKDHNLLYFYKFEERKGMFGDEHGELYEVDTDAFEMRRREYQMNDASCILQASGNTVFFEKWGIELEEFIEFTKKYVHNKVNENTKP